MQLPFSKYSGSGNDFIFIDNRSLLITAPFQPLMYHLCNRKQGVGADGVVLLENSHSEDFRMRIFNADGGEAEMCGNGARCLFRFLQELGENRSRYSIETMTSKITLRSEEDNVCVSMPTPFDFISTIPLEIEGKPLTVHHINTGVPHAVIFVSDINDAVWMSLAPKIRFHPRFSPAGVNVNFAKLESDNTLSLRTYERGVEAETLACGTGATAVALISHLLHHTTSPQVMVPASGERLKIAFKSKNNVFEDVELQGPAELTFKGVISIVLK